MTEEIDSTEETVVDPIDEVVEETLDSEEVVEPTEEVEETELQRLSRVNEDQRRELEGYRKPNIKQLQKQIHKSTSDNTAVENDYMSKSADVIDELESEFNSLKTADYKRIEPLILPAMKAIYDEAIKKGSYVARGKLKSVISELISYAQNNKVEKPVDQEQLDSAEISAVKPTLKMRIARATERDAQLAENSGVSVAVITANRLAKEKREAEFAKNITHV